jgi:amino acid permease
VCKPSLRYSLLARESGSANYNAMDQITSLIPVVDGGEGGLLQSAGHQAPKSSELVRLRFILTYVLTFLVIVIAANVESVGVVWAIMGSFSCIIIAFVCPPAAYLKVGCPNQRIKRITAWLILLVGAVLTVLCGVVTVYSLSAGSQ